MRFVPAGAVASPSYVVSTDTAVTTGITGVFTSPVLFNGQLYALLNTLYYGNNGPTMIGAGVPTGTYGTSGTQLLPGFAAAYTGPSARAFIFQDAGNIWIADDTTTWGQGGLWLASYSSSASKWMNGDIASPFMPAPSTGVYALSGRVEGASGFIIYCLATSGGLYRFVASTRTFTLYAALPLNSGNLFSVGVTAVPCDPAFSVCGAQNLPSPSAMPAPSPSSTPGAAVPFTPGSIVALRVGDGSRPLAATAAPLFVDEINPWTGALLQVRVVMTVRPSVQVSMRNQYARATACCFCLCLVIKNYSLTLINMLPFTGHSYSAQ